LPESYLVVRFEANGRGAARALVVDELAAAAGGGEHGGAVAG